MDFYIDPTMITAEEALLNFFSFLWLIICIAGVMLLTFRLIELFVYKVADWIEIYMASRKARRD